MLLPAEVSVSTVDDKFLKDFQGIIEENLDDSDFRIDIICERLEIGRATLFKKIKALTGETPNDFILSYRLERAALILREDKSRSIMDVALDVGFSGAPYFAKCFRDRFNQSPNEYQASHADKAKNP
jgi:AraC-like DNA-binding protein